MAASEAQGSKQQLFAPEGAGEQLYIERGYILLHKKLRTDAGRPMVYVVKEVGWHTEGDRPPMVAYQALYNGDVHFRPRDMFTTDRFFVLSDVKTIDRTMNR